MSQTYVTVALISLVNSCYIFKALIELNICIYNKCVLYLLLSVLRWPTTNTHWVTKLKKIFCTKTSDFIFLLYTKRWPKWGSITRGVHKSRVPVHHDDQIFTVAPHYGTCFVWPFWHMRLWGGFQTFGKNVYTSLLHSLLPNADKEMRLYVRDFI
jgi:hypothetical protein